MKQWEGLCICLFFMGIMVWVGNCTDPVCIPSPTPITCGNHR